jgi:hypothetical protein
MTVISSGPAVVGERLICRTLSIRTFGDPHVCELDCRLFISEPRNAPA